MKIFRLVEAMQVQLFDICFTFAVCYWADLGEKSLMDNVPRHDKFSWWATADICLTTNRVSLDRLLLNVTEIVPKFNKKFS